MGESLEASHKFDIVLFGATGFTGKYLFKELCRLSKYLKARPFSFAIAGRDKAKLEEFKVALIVADVNNKASLVEMTSQGRVLINCVGPFRHFGIPVVSACVEASCNYIDISGEPQFIEETVQMYHEQAIKKNISIISACGFDSVPADIGVLILINKMLKANYTPLSIESFIEIRNLQGLPIKGHYATFESAVYGFSNQRSLAHIRSTKDDKSSSFSVSSHFKRKKFPFFEPRIGKWCVSFPGSDPSIVRRSVISLSQQNYSPSFPYAAYFAVDSFVSLVALMIFTLVFFILTKFTVGVKLLLWYPSFFTAGIFSHEGPSDRELDTTFFSIKFFGRGFEKTSKEVADFQATISGPEPGYRATPIFACQAALTILHEESLVKKGAITPTEAFRDTHFIPNLASNGINFE